MLASSTFQLARDGRHVAYADDAGIAIVERASGRVTRSDGSALAAFADQLWIVAGDRLERRTYDGRMLGAPVAIERGAALVPSHAGVPAVLYGARLWIDDLGAFTEIALGDAPVVAPFAGRRWFTLARRGGVDRVQLGTASWTLPAGAQLEAASAAFDGNAVVLVVRRGGERVAWLSSVAGALHQRVELPGDSLRLAARAGWIVACDGCELAFVDLRHGRVVERTTWPHAIADVAIDADATTVAIRDEEGVHVVAVKELAARRAVAAVEPAPASVPGPAPVPVSVPVPAPVPVPVPVPAPLPLLVALSPRRSVPSNPLLARSLLAAELELVAANTLVAIADGWDTRRIGYANESEHPHEHEVAALVGANRGFATAHRDAARAELARVRAKLAADPSRRGADAPLAALAAELDLSELALDILLVVAAPALWGEAARLYGILANDPARPIVDELLVAVVLASSDADRHAIARELDPRSPLVRSGAIVVAGRRPFAELAADPVVIARLRGERPDLGTAVTTRTADRALDELVVPPRVIADAIAALSRAADKPARIALRGRPGTGRRALLAALAREANRELGVVEATRLPRAPEAFASALALVLRRVQLAGLAPCIVDLDRVAFGERTLDDVCAEVLREHPGPLAIALPRDATAPLEPGHIAIDLPVLDETARLATWRGVLAARGIEVRDPPALAARYRVGPGTIHRAVDATCAGDAPDAAVAIEAFLSSTRDARLSTIARKVERLASWTDLVLPPDVLDSLREFVARVQYRRQVFEDWGMSRAMATSRGLTALFQGPPGTGKTLVATAIARELGLDLYQVDLSKVMSKWIGETERNLATVFDAAEDGQVILLFDEADSLFAKRTEVRSSNDRYANLEVNYLLQRLDAFEGIAILTTNAGGAIDPAFKRRLSFRLSFPFPDEDTREQLWRAHLPPQLPIGDALSLDKLARKYQLSGGYIRNACLRAAFLAAREDGPVCQDHLERAVALEFAELGKLSSGGAIE